MIIQIGTKVHVLIGQLRFREGTVIEVKSDTFNGDRVVVKGERGSSLAGPITVIQEVRAGEFQPI